MWYAIISEDVDNSLPLRDQHRPQHVARLKQLSDQQRLLVAGPHPAVDSETPGEAGFTGSLIVAQFDSLEAAHQWVAEDPYVVNHVHARVTVKPFKKVLP